VIANVHYSFTTASIHLIVITHCHILTLWMDMDILFVYAAIVIPHFCLIYWADICEWSIDDVGVQDWILWMVSRLLDPFSLLCLMLKTHCWDWTVAKDRTTTTFNYWFWKIVLPRWLCRIVCSSIDRCPRVFSLSGGNYHCLCSFSITGYVVTFQTTVELQCCRPMSNWLNY
jgi:hypothetical protein